MIMETIQFMAGGKMLPKCGPTSDVIVNGCLKSSAQIEIFGWNTETLLKYLSNSGTRMHPHGLNTP